MCEIYITVKTQEMVAKVMLNEILCIEKIGRRIIIETCSDRYCFYGDMNHISSILDKHFYEVLHNYYVNFSRIRAMNKGRIIFDCGRERLLARDSFRRAKLNFYNYLKEHEKIYKENGQKGLNDMALASLMETFNSDKV
jgi:hypothetical protein